MGKGKRRTQRLSTEEKNFLESMMQRNVPPRVYEYLDGNETTINATDNVAEKETPMDQIKSTETEEITVVKEIVTDETVAEDTGKSNTDSNTETVNTSNTEENTFTGDTTMENAEATINTNETAVAEKKVTTATKIFGVIGIIVSLAAVTAGAILLTKHIGAGEVIPE